MKPIKSSMFKSMNNAIKKTKTDWLPSGSDREPIQS